MKVLTCSRAFPKSHPKSGQSTFFVEKIWTCPNVSIINGDLLQGELLNLQRHEYLYYPKGHTIRAGSRFKAGDMASLRVWSDKPYCSKQIEFAQVEIKKVWPVQIKFVAGAIRIKINDVEMKGLAGPGIAKNDGLEWLDFVNWFNIHPKKQLQIFTGQIICWSNNIEY